MEDLDLFLNQNISFRTKNCTLLCLSLKGIVSRDFGGLPMILMDRIGAPDVPLEVYSFLNFRFHMVF